MDPMTLGLLLNAGGMIASQIGGNNRPKYEIPDSAKQALGQARLLAYDQSSPGESRKMDAARLSSANAVRAAQEGGNALEAVAGIQGQENRATQGILAESEMDQRRDMDQYMNMLLGMGEKEDLQFQMNEFAPFADKQNEMRDILGAATQNMYNLAEKERLLSLLGSGTGSETGGIGGNQMVVNPDNSITESYSDNSLGSYITDAETTSSYNVYNKDGSLNKGATKRANKRAARKVKAENEYGISDQWSKNITDDNDFMSLLELLQKNLGKAKLLP